MTLTRIGIASLLLALVLPLTGFRKANYKKADEIMAELKQHQAAQSEVELIKMVIMDENDNVEVRELISAIKPDADGNLRYLIRFLSPEDISGVSLLTLEKPGEEEAEQYFYLPALGQPRQITGSQKNTPFMGSDFTFDDLRKENPEEFQYYRLLDEEIEGKEVYVIMSAPANIDISDRQDYASRLLYIDKDSYNILRIEFYNEGEKEPFKTFNGFDYGSHEIDGPTERPRRATMNSHATKTTSIMTVIKGRLNKPIPDEVFTVEALEDQTNGNEALLKILEAPQDAKTKS
ncbi:outer membrane lipoprotein-sorting protein [Ruficoccus amylovorans]|uniref:Outer membrane lipoprotein-sorting protein n=1 Tax=Ruficoccus amylovorans TaxID=1804625 RepID=A0A842HEN5_9BACT|nr:outer membrane lipoprotein-sorting protein [Ruficoccus amylovorans]MBC2594719.1 outer membrane lipoprotein-sorting protein [Ruficoccus amylovorans]